MELLCKTCLFAAAPLRLTGYKVINLQNFVYVQPTSEESRKFHHFSSPVNVIIPFTPSHEYALLYRINFARLPYANITRRQLLAILCLTALFCTVANASG